MPLIGSIESSYMDLKTEVAYLRRRVAQLKKENDLLNRKAKRNGRSRIFTQEEIKRINVEYTLFGRSQQAIAERYNTSQQRISEIINRQVTIGKDK